MVELADNQLNRKQYSFMALWLFTHGAATGRASARFVNAFFLSFSFFFFILLIIFFLSVFPASINLISLQIFFLLFFSLISFERISIGSFIENVDFGIPRIQE